MSNEALTSLPRAMRTLINHRSSQSRLRVLTTSPSTSLDFSSNDFLSFSTSARLKKLYLQELSNSSIRLGSGGSRLLDGNSHYAEQLEKDIAAFHNAPAALLFNSGFDANAGFFASVPQPNDVVLYDTYIHASVHDGMRLSRAAACIPFLHNSVVDLRTKLAGLVERDQLISDGKRSVFIALESLYSMDGDLAPLLEFVELVEQMLPAGNGYVIVDEAHSTGVYGLKGRGLVSSLGLENRIFARLHTFGKALSCNGAAILCSELTREYLINYARPMIYTTFMSYPALASIKTAYSFMKSGDTEPLAAHLHTLIGHFYTQLRTLKPLLASQAFQTPLLKVPDQLPNSPIFSLLTPHPHSLAKFCQDGGFVVRAIVPPTVPEGEQRVRVCLHAGNSFEDVENLVMRMKNWLEDIWLSEIAKNQNKESIKPRL